jgi:pimeloyl-ACP methyl ester carboxylesterase
VAAGDAASAVTRAPGDRPGPALYAQTAVEVRTRPISLGQSRVQHYRAGRGEIPVVIVHGAGDCVDSWLPVLRGVASFTEVVAFDRPGIGRSPAGPPATPEQYVTQLQDLLSRDSGRPVVLVGHSLGGLIAQLYARRHPDTVAGLVLVDATPESIAGDSAAQVGFAMSGLVAAMLKATASVGLLRSLFHLGAVPLYPESRHSRSLIGGTEFRDWVEAAVGGIAHNTRAELRSVIPTTRYALDKGDLAGPPALRW